MRMLDRVRQLASLFIIILLTTALLNTATAASNTTAATQGTTSKKLDRLRAQVTLLREGLKKSRAQKVDANQQLRQIEQRMGQQRRLVRKLDKQIKLQQTELDSLRKQQTLLSKNLNLQHKDLAQQVRAKYTLGQQEYVKLLLSQKNPATVSRTLAYYDYFNQARVTNINSINKELEQLERITIDIREKKEELTQVHDTRTQDLKSLRKTRKERKIIIAKINANIKKAGNKLGTLLEDERKLVALLEQLRNRPAQQPLETISRVAFKKLKGQMNWPTKGKITARYGSKRSGGDMRWKGVLIQAPEGNDVKAISHGHVIYANWLRGFGLLMIIDHGGGYMSLYGHNESLYKELGEWVEPNEVIASVGSSGGNPNSGLYFEIRRRGKPINPVKWCKK